MRKRDIDPPKAVMHRGRCVEDAPVSAERKMPLRQPSEEKSSRDHITASSSGLTRGSGHPQLNIDEQPSASYHQLHRGQPPSKASPVDMGAECSSGAFVTAATRREKALEYWDHVWKLELIERTNSDWVDLFPSLCGWAPDPRVKPEDDGEGSVAAFLASLDGTANP
ncbi:MAG: hypothetical protein P0Y50_10070 [Candidatus Brevundimonas colombiensis]|uniref:Uncharacterized protein n=1 Tax=Candidatus Brevundimonas colombiensis TaxID=3121376 RepID=A0AAJ5X2A9_9CAUL|nr:hypothetical protein [Brevundimonas sp.]WEK38895.1 MAG: hypothetical protein P0Y50_10070 [Brevundimonas sp.]